MQHSPNMDLLCHTFQKLSISDFWRCRNVELTFLISITLRFVQGLSRTPSDFSRSHFPKNQKMNSACLIYFFESVRNMSFPRLLTRAPNYVCCRACQLRDKCDLEYARVMRDFKDCLGCLCRGQQPARMPSPK